MKNFLLASLCAWLVGLSATAQGLPFRALPPIQATSADEVYDLHLSRQGLLWMGTNSGLRTYDGYAFDSYRNNAYSYGLLPNNAVNCLTEDGDGNLWVGTRNGLVRMDCMHGTFRTYHLPGRQQKIVYCLFTSRDGTVWAGTDGGLTRYVAEADTFLTYDGSHGETMADTDGSSRPVGNYSVKSMAEDEEGNLYVGTWNDGLLMLKRETGTFYRYPRFNSMNSAYTLFLDSRQRLWIGTWGHGLERLDNPRDIANPGLRKWEKHDDFNPYIYYYDIIEDPVTQTIWAGSSEGIQLMRLDSDSLASYTHVGAQQLASCWSLETDGRGNIWVSTMGTVVHIDTSPTKFRYWRASSPDVPAMPNSVTSLYTPDGRTLWLTLRPYGLAQLDRATGSLRYGRQLDFASGIDTKTLISSFSKVIQRAPGEVWMANAGRGIVRLREHGGAAETLHIGDSYVNTLYKARDGSVWVGQRSLVAVVFPDDSVAVLGKDEPFMACDARGIGEDRQGNMWVATNNMGVIKATPTGRRTFRFKQYCPKLGNLSADDVESCMEDSRGRLWAISMSGGLFRYDARADRFVAVTHEYNLSSNCVFAINEDSQGNLWLALDNALARLSFRGGNVPDVATFGKEDGLEDDRFNLNATFRHGRELFFGNKTGFVSFVPEEIGRQPAAKHPLLVTNVWIDGRPWKELDSTLRAEVSDIAPAYARRIVVPPSVKRVGVGFVLLTYTNPGQNKYAYKLEGYDEKWNATDARSRRAVFENLPVGTYRLRMKASDSRGTWTELPYAIEIKVLPPWYLAWWAFALYALLLAGAAYGLTQWYHRRLKTRNQLAMNTLFTNITHELLTPLSVISAAAETVRGGSTPPQPIDLIQNNVQRLTRLLRQILEVRKSQEGKLKLKVAEGDLARFVASVCENLRPLAESRGIALEVDCAGDGPAWFDSDKMEKVLYNLVSNAVKYTGEGGTVRVALRIDGRKRATLTVRDTGIGIAREKQKHLFTPFMDGDYRKMRVVGTGIGLALTHDLVKLHHGSIAFESEEGKGTAFTVAFPTARTAYAHDEQEEGRPDGAASIAEVAVAELPDAGEKGGEKEYTVLVVEDNAELLMLLKSHLGRRYNVLTARNGQQALNVLARKGLDIVVSDVMMPVMDGFELLRTIKQTEDYAQLPVVMLTAKTRDEDRAAGYGSGADAYLAKPFRMDELQLRIDSIIANRERVRRKFQTQTDFEVEEQHYSSPNEIFIQKAIDCVKSHLADADYNREQFAADLCVSSSTLYNKLRSITGGNVTEFINSIRLKEACRIMKANPHTSIAEVVAMVGYNTPKYFSKLFKAEFGMSPTEFLKSLSRDAQDADAREDGGAP